MSEYHACHAQHATKLTSKPQACQQVLRQSRCLQVRRGQGTQGEGTYTAKALLRLQLVPHILTRLVGGPRYHRDALCLGVQGRQAGEEGRRHEEGGHDGGWQDALVIDNDGGGEL